jgi:hypothetical protein
MQSKEESLSKVKVDASFKESKAKRRQRKFFALYQLNLPNLSLNLSSSNLLFGWNLLRVTLWMTCMGIEMAKLIFEDQIKHS